jgi:addiction module HigA family antidote
MTTRKPLPIHPGEILMEEFMKPLGLSQNQLARDLKIPPRRINQIVNGKRAITADTALRLARYFGTSPQLWMGFQDDYELDVAQEEKAEIVAKEVRTRAAANA